MSSLTRQRHDHAGASAATAQERAGVGELHSRASRRAAREAALRTQSRTAGETPVVSAEEIAAKARAEAARIAALPPWYLRKRYVLPLFAAAVFTVGTLAYVGTRPEPPPPPVVAAAPTIAAPSIGDTVTDGRFSFTVTSVTLAGDVIGQSFGSERAQGTWVVATVDVTNTAKVAGPLSASSQFVIDADKNRYAASMVPSLKGWDAAYIDPIAPGQTVSAQIPFDVPAGATLTTLELHDAQFGKGVTLPLR